MAKIIHKKRDECIGCGSCAALCADFWEMEDDNKATLRGGVQNDAGDYELEVEDAACNKEAADVCPVRIIEVVE